MSSSLVVDENYVQKGAIGIERLIVLLRAVGVVLLLGAVSWGVGLLGYRAALWVFFREVPSSGDWQAVVFWSGLICLVVLPFPLWFFTLTLHEKITGRLRFVVVPGIVAMTALVPTTLLAGIWGGGATEFSAESFLFCVLFATVAATFALAYGLIADRLF